MKSNEFIGYHSEWNLGSPGGWDYQRITQKIGKSVFAFLSRQVDFGIELDFDLPLLSPVHGLVEMLSRVHHDREGSNPGVIAVVAEEETLADVVENRNLAELIGQVPDLKGILTAPQELERTNGRVCWRGEPVSVIFMDFNTDVLLKLHRKHGLDPLLQAVRENRVINPRGTEPINVKSMFEVITDPSCNGCFHPETIRRTPWTRQFYPRRTSGPDGEDIQDLLEWTRLRWENLVLKPSRGYSGHGVRVGGVHPDVEDAVQMAITAGDYIVQQKVPLALWAEDMPEMNTGSGEVVSVRRQTDFRCLFGADALIGFVARYGQVPTNVGSGGGVQPVAVLRSSISVRDATERINAAIAGLEAEVVSEAVALQQQMAVAHQFTYLLGPVNMALRPRVITMQQIEALNAYCSHIWADCLTLEKMWISGDLDHLISLEPDELEIARSQPWGGSTAILASDGIFSFGAHQNEEH
ncbi:MAG: hypothetical protein AMJ54_04940 [Deltaproteobacteria bacterium SG8_13]|nr:MAG: hypothetical protein AMJ54_04940 [Deltaproteobacteria bacterium SG8_13]